MPLSGYQIGSVLEQWGIIDVILPFILVFTVSYAVLSRLDVFKDDKKYSTMIALVLGLMFIVPHITGRYLSWGMPDPVDIVNQSAPYLAVIIVAIVLLMVMVGLSTGNGKLGDTLSGLAVWVSVLAVFIIFGRASGWLPYGWLSFLDDPDVQALAIIILVFGIIIYLVTGGGESKGDGGFKKFLKLWSD